MKKYFIQIQINDDIICMLAYFIFTDVIQLFIMFFWRLIYI